MRPLLVCAFIILATASLIHVRFGYSHADHLGHAWGFDDAFISYRYARNLATGHGLVFNQGERVEGYSNFLYVILLAPAFFVADGFAIYGVSVALNICFILAALLVVYRHFRSQLGESAATIGALVLSLCPPLWVAVATGLETPLVLLIQVSIWSAVTSIAERPGEHRGVWLGVLLILLMLARADGFVFGLISCAYLLLRKKVSATVQAGAIGLTAAVAYFLWRYSYYGYILPNTYYAKVSGPLSSRVLIGLAQLRDLSFRAGILPYLLVIVIMLATVAQTWWKDRRVSWERVPIEGFLATCWIYYWLYIGGDHIAERMLLILFPLGLAGLLRLLRTSATRQVSAFVVLLVVLIQLTPLSIDERFEYSWTKYDMWITLGDFLSDGHAGEVLAIEAAGKVPYFSGMPTIDMLGLNDEYLAHKSVSFFSSGHNKYDADYVLGRKPDLIAAWINPDTLDMSWGLLRSKYEIAGYRIKYLVSCEEDLAPGNVVEVLSWKPETIQAVTYRGFHYAVLARLPSDTAPPRP